MTCWKTRRGCTLAWHPSPRSPVGAGGKRRHPRGYENTGLGADKPEAQRAVDPTGLDLNQSQIRENYWDRPTNTGGNTDRAPPGTRARNFVASCYEIPAAQI